MGHRAVHREVSYDILLPVLRRCLYRSGSSLSQIKSKPRCLGSYPGSFLKHTLFICSFNYFSTVTIGSALDP